MSSGAGSFTPLKETTESVNAESHTGRKWLHVFPSSSDRKHSVVNEQLQRALQHYGNLFNPLHIRGPDTYFRLLLKIDPTCSGFFSFYIPNFSTTPANTRV